MKVLVIEDDEKVSEYIRNGRALDLQPREFRLLEYLLRNKGQVVTRTMLLESVWDYHFDPQTNVIDVHISRLRGKLDLDAEPPPSSRQSVAQDTSSRIETSAIRRYFGLHPCAFSLVCS